MPALVKVNHLLFLSLSSCHLLYPAEHEEHLDLRAMQQWAQICLTEKGKARLCEWPLKIQRGEERETQWDGGSETDRSKRRKVGADKERLSKRGGQDCRGEREQLAIPKAIKVWFTHSLNKSTYRPSLPFFQVCGSCRSMPTPTLPLGFSFPVTLTWQNSEFQQGFAHMEDSCASCQSLHILHLLCVCLYGKRERERERGLPLMDCFVFCIKPQLWEQF